MGGASNKNYVALIFMLVGMLQSSQAFPNLWRSCSHPQGPQGRHQGLIADADIQFEVLSSSLDQEVTCYEPNTDYIIMVTFSEDRRAMLTASDGVFLTDQDILDRASDSFVGCEDTKTMFGPSFQEVSNEYQVTWTSPDGDEDDIELQITSSGGSTDHYRTASLTLAPGNASECSTPVETNADNAPPSPSHAWSLSFTPSLVSLAALCAIAAAGPLL